MRQYAPGTPRQDTGTYKAVFLIGDAPPHLDYQDDIKYPVTLSPAKEKGIVVNAIQCGQIGSTTPDGQPSMPRKVVPPTSSVRVNWWMM